MSFARESHRRADLIEAVQMGMSSGEGIGKFIDELRNA
jgi:uncharacterized protein YoaH (UPF0181 family)